MVMTGITSPPTPDRFAGAIMRALTEEANNLIEEEAEKAADAVRARLRRSMANVALSVFNDYDISLQGGVVVIRVRNEVSPPR